MYKNFREKREQARKAESSAPKKVTLTYFNGKGRAESLRYILAAGGVDFEDKRIEFSDWPALKPDVPFNALPMVEIDGQQVGQSIALCRMAALMTGLAGDDNFEQALVDSVGDVITDMREKILPVLFISDAEEKAAAKEKLCSETLPKMLGQIKDFHAQHGGSYLVGDKMTWADLHLAYILESAESVLGWKPDENYSKLAAVCDKVFTDPNVIKYREQRPKTDF